MLWCARPTASDPICCVGFACMQRLLGPVSATLRRLRGFMVRVSTGAPRWLRPGGALLPDFATMSIAAADASALDLDFWDDVAGLSFAPVRAALREAGSAPRTSRRCPLQRAQRGVPRALPRPRGHAARGRGVLRRLHPPPDAHGARSQLWLLLCSHATNETPRLYACWWVPSGMGLLTSGKREHSGRSALGSDGGPSLPVIGCPGICNTCVGGS